MKVSYTLVRFFAAMFDWEEDVEDGKEEVDTVIDYGGEKDQIFVKMLMKIAYNHALGNQRHYLPGQCAAGYPFRVVAESGAYITASLPCHLLEDHHGDHQYNCEEHKNITAVYWNLEEDDDDSESWKG